MSTFFNCRLTRNISLSEIGGDACSTSIASEGVGGLRSPVIVYNIDDIDSLEFENDSRADDNLYVETIYSTGAFYVMDFTSATYNEEYDNGKWTHTLTLEVSTIVSGYEDLLADATNGRYFVCFRPNGAEDYRAYGWKFGAKLDYAMNISSDSRGYTITLTDVSEYPLLTVKADNFGDSQKTYPVIDRVDFSSYVCEEAQEGGLSGYKIAMYVPCVNAMGQPLDRNHRLCAWTGLPQIAYKYEQVQSDGGYEIIGTYRSDATYDQAVKQLDLKSCSAYVDDSISISQKKNHAISLNSNLTASTFTISATSEWSMVNYPTYHVITPTEGVSGSTTCHIWHNGVGGVDVIDFINRYTNEKVTLTATTNIIDVSPNYVVTEEVTEVVITPIVEGCSSGYTYTIDPSYTTTKDSLGYIHLVFPNDTSAHTYTLSLEHDCDSGETATVTVAKLVDDVSPTWVLYYTQCSNAEDGVRINAYRDMNPLSPTYGHSKTEYVEDATCSQGSPNWVLQHEYCELDNKGSNTGYIIKEYEDVNYNSPTWMETRTERVQDSENCPIPSTDPTWVEDPNFDSYCEKKIYQPSGVEGLTGKKIVQLIDDNPMSSSYRATVISAITSADCPAPNTNPIIEEVSYNCELVDGEMTGYAFRTGLDTNPYSSTYLQTTTVKEEDSRCPAPIVECNCDSFAFNGTVVPEPTTFDVDVEVTNSASAHITFIAFQITYNNSQYDNVSFGSGMEVSTGQTVTEYGVELQQGHEGNSISSIAVNYKLGGVNQQRSLNSDEWHCTSGTELGQGDTLYINFKS